jgi:hypothetical protein
MTQQTRTSTIEAVVVTVNDHVLDCVSFSDKARAEAYKRSVRCWALQRGVTVRVWTQAMDVVDKAEAIRLGRLALAS